MDETQSSLFGRAKRQLATDWRLATPWGEADIRRREFGEGAHIYGTKPQPCDTVLGPVEARLELHLLGGEPFPDSLQLAIGGGLRIPDANPLRPGRLGAWDGVATIEAATGLVRGTPVITLNEANGEPCGEAGLAERVAEGLAKVVESWSRDHPAYAARAYATFARHAQADLESRAESLRSRLLDAANMRDEAARRAREAARIAQRGGEPLSIAGGGLATDVAYELRGFAGNPLDQQDLDEVLVYAPSFLHAETMSDTHAWMGVYLADGRRIAMNFGIVDGRLTMSAEVDDDGMD